MKTKKRRINNGVMKDTPISVCIQLNTCSLKYEARG